MTSEEIRSMTPGPEMDARVAELVMGWKRGEGDYESKGWMLPCGDKWCWAAWLAVEPEYEIGSDGHEYQVPVEFMGVKRFAPSVDIAAAWVVVEALRARGEWVNIETDDLPEYEVRIDTAHRRGGTIVAVAPTAPHAICRAALLALAAAGK